MADDFRKHQRDDWHGRRGANGTYGCPCCQRINCGRGKAKKISRKKAKAKVRQETAVEIRKETEQTE